MTSYLYYLRALPGQADSLADWLLNDFGPQLAASDDSTGLRINIAIDPPGSPDLYKNEAREGEHFDASIDLDCPDEAAFERLAGPMQDLAERTDACFGYEVERLVEKDDAEGLAGNPAPGYKIMRGFYFFDVLSAAAARHCWDNHVKLALKVHGFDRYVRYWVNKPVTEGAPAIGGATNLQFSSADKVLNGYFTVPDGMEQIQQDVGHFIERGLARIFAQEHVLK